MIEIKLLAFVAVLALYFKWVYGSPLAPGPSSPGDRRLKRATPLILFALSGLSLTISLLFQDKVGFFIFFSMSALFLLAVPITTFWLKRKK